LREFIAEIRNAEKHGLIEQFTARTLVNGGFGTLGALLSL
jgi:hypothetical protein